MPSRRIRAKKNREKIAIEQGETTMMKTTALYRILAVACLLGWAGCKQSTDRVEQWKVQGNAKKLVGALGSDDRAVRIAAIEALGELKTETATDAIGALIADPDPQIVLPAVEALVSIGNEAAENYLLIAINLDYRKVCFVAISGLGTLKSTRAIEPLIVTMCGPDDELAAAAAAALGQIGDKRAIKPLIGKVQNRSHSLRLACVESLGNLGGQEAIKGLALALNDISRDVRQAATQELVAAGGAARPYALTSLRSSEAQARLGGIAILEGIDRAPTTGSDHVWYQLAHASPINKAGVDMELVEQLADMGTEAVDALVEAVAHPAPDIREHAFRALETIGEPALLHVIDAAEAQASDIAKKWYAERSSWAGAPSWRIDLWGGATALSPDFRLLGDSTDKDPILRILSATKSQPRREFIPLLITLNTDDKSSKIDLGLDFFGTDVRVSSGRKYTQEATQRLIAAGDIALLPLTAALEDSDSQMADSCAAILGEIGNKRAAAPMAEVLSLKIETGEHLTGSPFYTSLQKLGDPSTDALLRKVRPNEIHARRLFEKQFPDYHIISIQSKNAFAAYTAPIGYQIGYFKDGKTGTLNIVFKKNSEGDWVPTPPLPAKLP